MRLGSTATYHLFYLLKLGQAGAVYPAVAMVPKARKHSS